MGKGGGSHTGSAPKRGLKGNRLGRAAVPFPRPLPPHVASAGLGGTGNPRRGSRLPRPFRKSRSSRQEAQRRCQLGRVPPTYDDSPRHREGEPGRCMPPLPAAIVALPCHLARGTVCRGALPPAPLSLAPHSPGSGARLFAAPARAADGEKPFQMAGAGLRQLNILTIWPRSPDCKTEAFKRIARVAKKKKKVKDGK